MNLKGIVSVGLALNKFGRIDDIKNLFLSAPVSDAPCIYGFRSLRLVAVVVIADGSIDLSIYMNAKQIEEGACRVFFVCVICVFPFGEGWKADYIALGLCIFEILG